jgi:thymidylate kinase
MEVVGLLDSLVDDRVLIFGSLPPGGRDIDLLVQPPEAEALARGLTEHGFAGDGHRWVRFADCSAQAVDLVPAGSWAVEPSEREALFSDAIPLEGARHLARPAPHHALLILAARVARDGRFDERRRARLEAELAADPGVWESARTRAAAWGAGRSLAVLERVAAGDDAWRRGRARAVAEQLRAEGVPNARAAVWGWRLTANGRPPGRLLTFSGVDGAGKSTQCEALAQALRNLGYDAVVEWSRLGSHPLLDRVALPVKQLLGRRALARAGDGGQGVRAPAAHEAARGLRRRSPAMNFVWATVVALTNVSSQRTATRRHLRAGRVVICDRYTPDSLAALRWEYGHAGSLALHRWIVRALSPRPLRSYFLSVSPEAAFRRKGDFPVEELARQAAIYRQTLPELDVVWLSGELPREELCSWIARDAWRALG